MEFCFLLCPPEERGKARGKAPGEGPGRGTAGRIPGRRKERPGLPGANPSGNQRKSARNRNYTLAVKV